MLLVCALPLFQLCLLCHWELLFCLTFKQEALLISTWIIPAWAEFWKTRMWGAERRGCIISVYPLETSMYVLGGSRVQYKSSHQLAQWKIVKYRELAIKYGQSWKAKRAGDSSQISNRGNLLLLLTQHSWAGTTYWEGEGVIRPQELSHLMGARSSALMRNCRRQRWGRTWEKEADGMIQLLWGSESSATACLWREIIRSQMAKEAKIFHL